MPPPPPPRARGVPALIAHLRSESVGFRVVATVLQPALAYEDIATLLNETADALTAQAEQIAALQAGIDTALNIEGYDDAERIQQIADIVRRWLERAKEADRAVAERDAWIDAADRQTRVVLALTADRDAQVRAAQEKGYRDGFTCAWGMTPEGGFANALASATREYLASLSLPVGGSTE